MPGHKCPGYVSTKKPPEGGSIPSAASLSRLQPAFRFHRSPGIYARAGRRRELMEPRTADAISCILPPKRKFFRKANLEMLSPRWLQVVLALTPLVLAVRTEREAARSEGPEGDAAALVRRIQAGDPMAESELVARFSRGLLLMLRRLV